jgi:hypothetical protein
MIHGGARPWLLGLGLASIGLTYFIWQSSLWVQGTDKLNRELIVLGTGQPAPEGPIYVEPDSYLWLTYAQRIASGETWRVRWTMTDQAPEGRAVHWSQSVSWALALLGHLRHPFYPEESLRQSVENGSYFLNGLLYVGFCLLVFLTVERGAGAWAAGAAVLLFSVAGDVMWAFQPLRPDHQTLHLIFGIGSILAALAGGLGLRKARETPKGYLHEARVWMWISALATGGGMWVSATVQSFFLAALAGTTLTWLWLAGTTGDATQEDEAQPELWVEWGMIAAVVSLFFYGLEYFPALPLNRLEINHPIYAATALATGIGLFHAMKLKFATVGSGPLWRWILALAGTGCALIPLVLLLRAPAEFHTMRTVEMLRLHNFIKEFYLYTNLMKEESVSQFIRAYGLLSLSLLAAPLLGWKKRMKIRALAWIWVLFLVTLAFLALGLFQVRWLPMYAVSASLLTAVLLGLWIGQRPHWLRISPWAGLTCLLLAGQVVYWMQGQVREIRLMLQGKTLIRELLEPAYIKNLAVALNEVSPRPKAILCDPNFSPAIAYFSGIPTVVSFYWENLEGLRAATAIWATEDWDEAYEVMNERGITHILLMPSDYLSNSFYFIKHGHYDLEASKRNLAGAILYENGPAWLKSDFSLTLLLSGRYRYLTETLESPVLIFRVEEESQ